MLEVFLCRFLVRVRGRSSGPLKRDYTDIIFVAGGGKLPYCGTYSEFVVVAMIIQMVS
jgi:hypothetical protein